MIGRPAPPREPGAGDIPLPANPTPNLPKIRLFQRRRASTRSCTSRGRRNCMSNTRKAVPLDAEPWLAKTRARVSPPAGDTDAGHDLSSLSQEVIQALREERDSGAALCDAADTLIVVLDAQGRIVRFNPACERLTQYTAAEVVGRRLWDLFLPPAEAESIRASSPTCAQTDSRTLTGTTGAVGTAALRVIAWANTALLHSDGTVKHVVAQGVDITAHAEADAALRESEARYQRIAANVPGVVYQFVLRPDGTTAFPFVSEGCRELYGVSPEDICADPELILGVVSPRTAPSSSGRSRSLPRPCSPGVGRDAWSSASGAEKWLEATSRPARRANGDIVWDGILMDVTERNGPRPPSARARACCNPSWTASRTRSSPRTSTGATA